MPEPVVLLSEKARISNAELITKTDFGPAEGSMGGNGLQLGEVAEIEAQMFNFAQKFNRRTAVDFCTKPAILPNCCYALFFYIIVITNGKSTSPIFVGF